MARRLRFGRTDAVKQSNSIKQLCLSQAVVSDRPAGVLVVEHAFEPDFAEQFLEAWLVQAA